MSRECEYCDYHDYLLLHGYPPSDYYILIVHRIIHLWARLQGLVLAGVIGVDQGQAVGGG